MSKEGKCLIDWTGAASGRRNEKGLITLLHQRLQYSKRQTIQYRKYTEDFAVVHEKGQQVAELLLYYIGLIVCSLTFFLLVEDLESHDGSAERPYYMSKSLLKILNKQNMQTKRQ